MSLSCTCITFFLCDNQQSMCAILHKQTREMVYMVHGYVRWEADNVVPLHDAANCNEQMVVGCVCLRTIQNIANQSTTCTILLFENHLIFSH
jgi:hypothetical protein